MSQFVLGTRPLIQGIRSLDLLDLPGEILNHIYSYAVTTSDGRDVGIGGVNITGKTPCITAVSRRLRRETLPIYYALNHFTTELGFIGCKQERLPINKWLLARAVEDMKYIAHITIFYNSDYIVRTCRADIQALMSQDGLVLIREVAKVVNWTYADRAEASKEQCNLMRGPGWVYVRDDL